MSPLLTTCLSLFVNCEVPRAPTHRLFAELAGRSIFWGHLFENLIAPYTSPGMSLAEQLTSLSTAAHILLALYTQPEGKGKFMPVQLYADIMIMIKNAFFCVAKMKAFDPSGSFWLILLGTDRLEVLFGMVRTMTSNDVNPDLLQLSQRLADAGACAEILARFPKWDRLPRRLQLPEWSERGDVSAQADHINPGSWKGDVKVANVTLATSWREGRKLATRLLSKLQTAIDWTHFTVTPDIDILQPFGQPILKHTGEIPLDDDEREDGPLSRLGLDENRNHPAKASNEYVSAVSGYPRTDICVGNF